MAHSAPVASSVSAGTNVLIWVLGLSVNGVSIAGQLSLPFSVASHFPPEETERVIQTYRETFTTEAPTEEAYVMAGIKVMVADTDEEATRQFTVVQQMSINIRRGQSRKLQPPVDPETLAAQGAANSPMLRIKAVGSPQTVKAQLKAFVEQTGVDELIILTYDYDPPVREHSLQLLADVWF